MHILHVKCIAAEWWFYSSAMYEFLKYRYGAYFTARAAAK